MRKIKMNKKFKPLLYMRKRSLLGSFFTKHSKSTTTLSKSVGQAVESGVIPTIP